LLEEGDPAQLEWVSTTRYSNPFLVAQLCALRPHDVASFSKFIEFIYHPPLDLNNTLILCDTTAVLCLEACGVIPELVGCLFQYGTLGRFYEQFLKDVKPKSVWLGHDALVDFLPQLPNFYLNHLMGQLCDKVE